MKIPASFNCCQASAWPPKNNKPKPVPMVHQVLNLPRDLTFRARRAISSATLEASSTAVFTHRICGLAMLAQSSERPRRTTSALVSAANTMLLAASKTYKPVNEARREEPRPSEPPPSPQPGSTGGGGPCRISCVSDPAIFLKMRQPCEGTEEVGGSFCMM